MKHIIRLFVLIAALVLGTDHAWAGSSSNPRVKFVYESEHGFAFASDADANRLVTITVTPDGDYRCIAGDLTAEESVNSNKAEAPRRSPGVGQSVAVTCTATNVFTLTLPEDEMTNVTVYVKFSSKVPLTVTANNKNIEYGDEPANNGVTYSGFEGTDDASVLGGTLSFGYTYNQYGPVGDYQITPYGLTSDNYAITFVPGTLTVAPKFITIASVNVENKEYDGTTAATLSGTFSFNDGMIVGSDDVSISFNGASAVFDNKDAGNGKEVTVTGLALTGEKKDNYDLTNPDFTTTGDITKKNLTVTANDWTIDYGEEPANDDVEYDGFVNGEGVSALSGTLGYSYTYNQGDPVGTYQIIPSGLTSNNYNIIFQPGTLTVNQKATISVDWEDNNNVDGLRPASLEFKLLANGSETGLTVTLNEGNDWRETVNGLTAYNGETLIPYTWSLETPPEYVNNYESNDNQSTSNTGATATFTLTRKTGSLTVSNTVVSDLAADADVPFTYTVKLTNTNISGTYSDMTFTDGEASVTLKAGESATATGLLYGTTYTVTQADAEGFTNTGKTGDEGTISTASTLAVFTNTRETGNLKVTNTVYPSGDDTDFVFTVTLTNAPVTGTYGDMSFSEGVATVTLKGGESAEATSLPTTVGYTVTQVANEGFSTTKTGSEGTISTTQSEAAFKNIMLTEARFDIDWCDGGNTSSRPELTTTLLSKIDGDESQQVQTITLNEENDWQATITNLPMYNDAGLEIAYSWSEIANVPSGYLLTDYLTGKDASYTYTLKTSATVTISWDDANNQDGKRPTEMTATLSDGSEYNKTVTLNSTNNWTATVENLPKYKVDNSEITYTWTQNGTLPEGYASTDPSIDGIVTTITNSHTPEVTQVKVSKVWDDNNNAEGFRTESVTVRLKKGDTEIESVVLHAGNEWTHTWTGLDKYDHGTAINYTVTEDQVANYETPIIEKTSETEWEYTVTNSRTVEKTQVSVEAIWNDNNNAEGFRPMSVTVHLMKGETDLGSVELNANNSWEYTWSDLQKYENGTAINYTVTEDEVANYETPIIEKTSETEWEYTVTNSRTVEKTQVSVEAIWNDNNNAEGFQPDNITVKLLADGEEVGTTTLNADNEWNYTFTGLNKYADGQEIEYTLRQDQLAYYKTPVIEKVSETEWEYTVTNSRDLEVTEATVKVEWVDADDELHNRPESVTATLLANGTDTENTVTMNAENGWTATLTELQKYSNGTGVVYTWLQGALPEGYKQTNSTEAEAVTTFTDSYYPAVTVTITGNNNETTYDGTEHTTNGYEVTDISYSLYTDAFFTFNGEASASQTNAGTAYMGLEGSQFTNTNQDYDGKVEFVIAADGYQTITSAPVTVKADNKSKVWGTADDPTLTATVTGMVNDEDASTLIDYTIDRATGTITDGVENSGEYTITPTGDATQGNYAVTYETGTFTIEGKPVTIQDAEGHDVSSVENAYTITQDQDGVTLTLVVPVTLDETPTPPTVDIPVAVEVDRVEIERTFIANRASTVFLPFPIKAGNVSGGKFHTFTNVDETTTPWTVVYTEVTGNIEANTPYIFIPDGSNGGKIVVNNGTDKVTVCTANQHMTENGQWDFIGTYKRIMWTHNTSDPEYTTAREAEIGSIYGFAAEEKSGATIGQFVKVTDNVWIDPMRAYLKNLSAVAARSMNGDAPTTELPDAMKVVIVEGNGEATSLTPDPSPRGEGSGYYTLDGRKLDKKPTAKGIYIHNGRKEVIK